MMKRKYLELLGTNIHQPGTMTLVLSQARDFTLSVNLHQRNETSQNSLDLDMYPDCKLTICRYCKVQVPALVS